MDEPTETPEAGQPLEPELNAPKLGIADSSSRALHKKTKTWLVPVLGLIIAAGLVWLGFTTSSDTNDASQNNQAPTIGSYGECVEAGYPVMESYPEQCAVPGGETFVRTLTAEEQAVIDYSEKIPEGWLTYNNEEMGIKFAYPSNWGAPSFTDSTEAESPGKQFTLEFSKNDKIEATVRSKDWDFPGGLGRGGANWDSPNFYSEVSDELRFGDDQIVIKQEDDVTTVAYCSEFLATVQIDTYVNIGGDTFDVAKFYYVVSGPKADGSGVDYSGCENLESLFEEPLKVFTEFTDTIELI